MAQDRLPGRRSVTLRAILLLCLALMPRFFDLSGHDLTSDEPSWIERGVDYLRKIARGNPRGSTHLIKEHPGITAAALVGSACMLQRRLTGDGWDFLNIWSYKKNNLAIHNYAFVARAPIAFLGALTCMLLYVMGRRIWPEHVALWAGVFLSIDPFHIALSRVAHLDALLTFFGMLGLFLFYRGERDSSLRWKLWAGLAMGMALLTKTSAALLVLVCVFASAAFGLLEGRGKSSKVKLKLALKRVFSLHNILALAVALGVFVLFFPRMWYEAPLSFIRHFTSAARLGEDEHWNFFMGVPTWGPPFYYYPVTVFARLTPLASLSVLLAVIFGLVSVWRSRRFDTGSVFLVLWILVFAGAMSVAAKKFDRYVLAIWPALALAAASGLSLLCARLRSLPLGTRLILRLGRFAGGALARPVVVAAVIMLSSLPAVVHLCPNYFFYFSGLIGGPRAAQSWLFFGWGEGHGAAMDYIASTAGNDRRVVVCGYPEHARYYYPGPVESSLLIGPGSREFPKCEYLVVYINRLQRLDVDAWEMKIIFSKYPEHVVHVNGIPVAWIYNLKALKPRPRVVVESVGTDKASYLTDEPITIWAKLRNQDSEHGYEALFRWRVGHRRFGHPRSRRLYLGPGEEKVLVMTGRTPPWEASDITTFVFIKGIHLPPKWEWQRVPVRVDDPLGTSAPDELNIPRAGFSTSLHVHEGIREMVPGDIVPEDYPMRRVFGEARVRRSEPLALVMKPGRPLRYVGIGLRAGRRPVRVRVGSDPLGGVTVRLRSFGEWFGVVKMGRSFLRAGGDYRLKVSAGTEEGALVRVLAGGYEIGMEYLRRGDLEEAGRYLREAAEEEGDREARLWLGVVKEAAGDIQGALSEWGKLDERYIEAYSGLAEEGVTDEEWGRRFLTVAGVRIEEYERAASVVYEAENLPQEVGKIVRDKQASGGKAAHYNGRGEGYLVFGPYHRYEDGWYEVRYRVRAEGYGEGEVCGRVSVARRRGEEVVGRDLKFGVDAGTEYGETVLGFRNEDGRERLEFRMTAMGGGKKLWVDRIEVRPDMRKAMLEKAKVCRDALHRARGWVR